MLIKIQERKNSEMILTYFLHSDFLVVLCVEISCQCCSSGSSRIHLHCGSFSGRWYRRSVRRLCWPPIYNNRRSHHILHWRFPTNRCTNDFVPVCRPFLGWYWVSLLLLKFRLESMLIFVKTKSGRPHHDCTFVSSRAGAS